MTAESVHPRLPLSPAVRRTASARILAPRGARRAGTRLPAVTRLSQYFLPTVKEPPADAEAISHKLLVRAGMVRQVGTGLWTFLPAGWRAHRKAEQIIREEMDRIGTQEMLMPLLTPAELWKKTGRYAS